MALMLRAAELDWKLIDDEIVALDARTAEYLAIEGSGVALWKALAGGTTRQALVDALVARYGIEAERAAEDTDAFLAELTSKGLLEA